MILRAPYYHRILSSNCCTCLGLVSPSWPGGSGVYLHGLVVQVCTSHGLVVQVCTFHGLVVQVVTSKAQWLRCVPPWPDGYSACVSMAWWFKCVPPKQKAVFTIILLLSRASDLEICILVTSSPDCLHKCKDWFAWCQFTVTGCDKFYLQVSLSVPNCLGRSTPEIHFLCMLLGHYATPLNHQAMEVYTLSTGARRTPSPHGGSALGLVGRCQ